MKRLKFHRAIVAIAMMLIGWLPSLAQDFDVDGIYYTKTSDNTVEVTYHGRHSGMHFYDYVGNVTIPLSVKYNDVTYNVTSIGEEAFYYCESLTSIQIPNSVTCIKKYAFYHCTSLTSIEIPNSVTSIDNFAFNGCESLTSIVVDAGNTVYDSRENCNAIIETATNTLIAGFQNTIIPNSVTSIGKYAFRYCSNLISITVPDTVTTIEEWAFSYCSGLTSIEISNSVKSIDNGTFSNCSSLSHIEIPNSVTSIGEWAFSECKSLTSVEIPNNVKWVGSKAFSYCANLTSIKIGSGTKSIETDSFSGCNSLNNIIVDADNTIYDTRENCNAIIKTSNNELIIGCKSTKIPNSVTRIGGQAFYDCDGLISIEIPNSVTSIGSEAFRDCGGLTSIKLSNSIQYINMDTFRECTSLTSIEIPNSVREIDLYAFKSCSGLTNIKIGNSVSIIKGNAFQYCSKLSEIICLATTPPQITSTTFSVYSADLYVPKGCKEAYENADHWLKFNIIELPTLSSSITLDKTEANILIGDTMTLTASVLPEDAYNKTVEWASSNESVATVDANGLVLAIALGEAIISATTTDGSDLAASCKVNVIQLVESITLDKTEISLEATETATLVATILPELATNKVVTWSSSNESVATVHESGFITAIAVGEATITATTADGSNLSASCKVTVVPTLVESITLDKAEINLEATKTATLVATVLPELATNKSVTWTSSNEAVATVDANGVVTAVKVGEATITATTVDGSNLSASCKVIVIPTLAISIELDKTEASVEEKSDLQLTATILPEHATNKEVAWSSSEKWVATVDNTGLVTIHSAGEVIITATTTDGTNLSATCSINVYSGIDGVNGDDVIVATVGDNIIVENAKLGSVVNVYSSNGALVKSVTATDGSVVIEAPVKGVYVVKVGKQTVKVII